MPQPPVRNRTPGKGSALLFPVMGMLAGSGFVIMVMTRVTWWGLLLGAGLGCWIGGLIQQATRDAWLDEFPGVTIEEDIEVEKACVRSEPSVDSSHERHA